MFSFDRYFGRCIPWVRGLSPRLAAISMLAACSSNNFQLSPRAMIPVDVKALAKEKLLYSFTGGADGATPEAGLLQGSAGNLYGTAYAHGSQQRGTVFELGPGGLLSVLTDFEHSTAESPNATLVADAAGNLYGETELGTSCSGTVFDLSRPATGGSWTLRVIHCFKDGRDGALPWGGLTRDKAGNLYGTTTGGGSSNCGPHALDPCGTVFELIRPRHNNGRWREVILHVFQPLPDGFKPYAAPVLDAAGNVYGTTLDGGDAKGCVSHRRAQRHTASLAPKGACYFNGTVFELTPPSKKTASWTETVLHSFTGAEGVRPYAPLVLDSSGNLYGTASAGGFVGCGLGRAGCGTVFRLTRSKLPKSPWTAAAIYSFPASGRQGASPTQGLLFDRSGHLYGATDYGGLTEQCLHLGCGTVFRLTPIGSNRWAETILHAFSENKGNGIVPNAPIFGRDGNLYGTTPNGGAYAVGTIYEVTP